MKALCLFIAITAALSACKKGDGTGRLERDSKLICDSNASGTFLPSKIVLDEKQAKEWGAALEASGNCDAVVPNMELRSPGVALKAGGNAKLVIDGGILQGGKNAVEISGNASVEFRGTTVLGKIKKSGNAKVTGLDTIKKTEEKPKAEPEKK